MIHLAKTIATACGIGYINNGKGAGTVAALLFCIVWYLTPSFRPWIGLAFLIIVLAAGVWSSTIVEKIWGKDNNKVVIDEVAGMMVVLLFIPAEIRYIIIALILFRFFDILKPLGIRKLELLPSGWGVMADDIVAGIYSLIVMRIILLLNLF